MTQPPYGPRTEDDGAPDEVALLLADARAKAQAIIDESLDRAQELLRPQTSSQQLERIRRTVADIAVDVRAVHSRLDEIEALIRGGTPAYRSPAAAPPPYAPPYAPPAAPPAYAYPSEPVYRAPEPPPYQPPAQQYQPPPAYAPPEPGYAAPLGAREQAPPASAIPPQRMAPPPPPPPPAAMQPAAAPSPVQPPPAAPEVASPAPAASRGFEPEGGSVALRVSPVAGFQGLMRVQDALTRCRGVREAGVEAYAQGEARLRLHLADHIDGAGLARSLGEILGREARVTAESVTDRTIQLALE